MTALFAKLVTMSITASYLIAAVILLRLFLKKIPKKFICVLWILAAVRLLVPVSLESDFSLLPKGEVAVSYLQQNKSVKDPAGNTAEQENTNTQGKNTVGMAKQDRPLKNVNTKDQMLEAASMFWLIGLIFLLGYSLFTYVGLRKKTATSIPLEKGIYQSDGIHMPFVLGVIKPRIYLPFTLSSDDLPHVIAHEKAHIERRDYLIKPVAFLLLCVYWFNPFIWAAYILLCRDIEFACDEKVIEKLALEERKQYSYSLLNCSVERKQIQYCPVAFGEVGVKERIQNVLHYKKASFWLLTAAVLSCVIVAVCFLTNPSERHIEVNKALEKSVAEAILTDSLGFPEGECAGEGHKILRVTEKKDVVTVYAVCSYGVYQFLNGNLVNAAGTGSIPTVMRFSVKKNGSYKLIEYQVPADGSDYVPSIKKMFPLSLQKKVINYDQKRNDELTRQEEVYAKAYLKKIGRKAKVGEYGDFEYTFLSDAGVSAMVSNQLIDRFPDYPYFIGTKETVEEGKRYVYEVSWDSAGGDRGMVTYRKEEADTKEIVFLKSYNVAGDILEDVTQSFRQGKKLFETVTGKDGVKKYKAEDGTLYQYFLTLSGTMPNAAKSSVYYVLSNSKDLTFDEVAKSLYSSNSDDFLKNAVIVGWD